MSERKGGWFADTDRDNERGPLEGWFQPCLDMPESGLICSFDVWFDSREKCEAFIRDEVIPIAGNLEDA